MPVHLKKSWVIFRQKYERKGVKKKYLTPLFVCSMIGNVFEEAVPSDRVGEM